MSISLSNSAEHRRSRGRRGRSTKRSRSPRRKKKVERKKKEPSRQIVLKLGGLSGNVRKEHLLEIFNHFGEVKSVTFPKRKPKGQAFIKYTDNKGAEKGFLFMNKASLDGNTIFIDKVYE